MNEIPVLVICDALEAGLPLRALATVLGTSEVGLVTACITQMASCPDEYSNDVHARCCSVLSVAIDPTGPLTGAR